MLRRAAQRLRSSRSARLAARGGLVARAGLYLLLALLAAAVAGGWNRDGVQANANGALTAVAARPAGWLALAAAAVGLAAFGTMRLAGAYADRTVRRLRRLTTAGQAVFYLAMAAGTTAFLLGDRRTGSTQQQDSTAVHLVATPVGRLLLAAAGVVVVAVCCWQVRLAVQGGFRDSLLRIGRGEDAAHAIGRVGIVARAVAVLPVGALLVVAAVRGQARQARDLDQLLDVVVQQPAGRVVVWLVAAGFLVFAVYSLVEVRYREVQAGD